MIPLALFQSRSFSGANLLTLFLYAATGIFFFLFPMNLIQVQGYSPTATGAAALPTYRSDLRSLPMVRRPRYALRAEGSL